MRLAALLAVAVLLAACSDTPVFEPNEDISFIVGDWEASSFVLTNPDRPVQNVDIVSELGGRFELFVEPSGRYTALLIVVLPQPPESGLLYRSGDLLVLDPDAGEPTPTEFAVEGETIRLRGDSEFDFDLDGDTQDARLEIVLVPMD